MTYLQTVLSPVRDAPDGGLLFLAVRNHVCRVVGDHETAGAEQHDDLSTFVQVVEVAGLELPGRSGREGGGGHRTSHEGSEGEDGEQSGTHAGSQAVCRTKSSRFSHVILSLGVKSLMRTDSFLLLKCRFCFNDGQQISLSVVLFSLFLKVRVFIEATQYWAGAQVTGVIAPRGPLLQGSIHRISWYFPPLRSIRDSFHALHSLSHQPTRRSV